VTYSDYEVVVHTTTGDVELPWTAIRRMTDTEFEEHWAQMAAAEDRRVGACIRKLRVMRNLTGREVAIRAQITPQSLSRIEHGHHDVAFQTLSRILAAMGCNLRDLADVQLAPSH
jgi:DNA-binding Xre family transcriptional regulator